MANQTLSRRSFSKFLAAGAAYSFQPALIFNLEADDTIGGHSDITGKEVAHAIRSAMT